MMEPFVASSYASTRSTTSELVMFANGSGFETSVRLSWAGIPAAAMSSVPSLSRRHLPLEQIPPRPLDWTMANVELSIDVQV